MKNYKWLIVLLFFLSIIGWTCDKKSTKPTLNTRFQIIEKIRFNMKDIPRGVIIIDKITKVKYLYLYGEAYGGPAICRYWEDI